MKNRCLNPNCRSYPRYGGRGIKVYEEWVHDFGSFIAYVGPKPAGLTLDRIDNDGNYEPGNVRWATPKQQANNRYSPPRRRPRVPQMLCGKGLHRMEGENVARLHGRRRCRACENQYQREHYRQVKGTQKEAAAEKIAAALAI